MKALKTNSKEVIKQVEAHILDCVTDEDGKDFNSIVLACRYMYCEFDRVANYPNNLKSIPNEQERFADYLRGIPFSFDVYYYDMAQFLNFLGINPQGKIYSDEKVSKLYYYLIYKVMVKYGKQVNPPPELEK